MWNPWFSSFECMKREKTCQKIRVSCIPIHDNFSFSRFRTKNFVRAFDKTIYHQNPDFVDFFQIYAGSNSAGNIEHYKYYSIKQSIIEHVLHWMSKVVELYLVFSSIFKTLLKTKYKWTTSNIQWSTCSIILGFIK